MITIRKLSDSQAEEIQIELKQDFPWKEYPQAKGNYPLALCLKSDDVAEEKRGIRLDFPSETAFRMFRDLLYPLYSIYIFNYGCHGPFWKSHEIYPGVPFDYKYLIPKKNPKAVCKLSSDVGFAREQDFLDSFCFVVDKKNQWIRCPFEEQLDHYFDRDPSLYQEEVWDPKEGYTVKSNPWIYMAYYLFYDRKSKEGLFILPPFDDSYVLSLKDILEG